MNITLIWTLKANIAQYMNITQQRTHMNITLSLSMNITLWTWINNMNSQFSLHITIIWTLGQMIFSVSLRYSLSTMKKNFYSTMNNNTMQLLVIFLVSGMDFRWKTTKIADHQERQKIRRARTMSFAVGNPPKKSSQNRHLPETKRRRRITEPPPTNEGTASPPPSNVDP